MCLNIMNTMLICKYSGIIYWNTKRSKKKKKDTQHYWEMILHYSRIHHIYAIFVEKFDKLINLSFSNLSLPLHKSPLLSKFLSVFDVSRATTHKDSDLLIFCSRT